MGGVVACGMMGSNDASFHAETAPMQLDIIVPGVISCPTMPDRFDRFLRAMNYELLTPCAKLGPYAACCHKVMIYQHPVIFPF
jgi:hypothetical protein